MSKKILIVDDDVLNIMSLEIHLQNSGYEVLELATNIEQAKEILVTSSPDLILLDINLNDIIDGIDLAHFIRKKYLMPIIFFTGYSNESIANRIDKIQNSYYIGKPIDPIFVKNFIDNLFKIQSI